MGCGSSVEAPEEPYVYHAPALTGKDILASKLPEAAQAVYVKKYGSEAFADIVGTARLVQKATDNMRRLPPKPASNAPLKSMSSKDLLASKLPDGAHRMYDKGVSAKEKTVG